MIVEHYGIKVNIPTPKFGNERDMSIRDFLEKLTKILNQKKMEPEKRKREVIALLKNLEHLCQSQ